MTDAPAPALGKRPRPVFLLVGIAVAVLVGIGLFTGYSPVKTAGPPEVGSRAPTFSLPPFGSRPSPVSIGLPSFVGGNGKPVVLLFFASWCPPCRTELPALAKAYAAERKGATSSFRRVWVLGVDGLDTEAAGKAFITGSGVRFPVADDAHMAVTQSVYGFLGDPAAVFISGSGTIEQIVRGSMSPARFAAGERRLLGSA